MNYVIDANVYEAITRDRYMAHYGILRRSGRYPWGSGGNVETRSKEFFNYVSDMKKQGLTDADIARGLQLDLQKENPRAKFSTTNLRQTRTIARQQLRAYEIRLAEGMKDRGMSNVEIGKRMGKPESSVRALLKDGEKAKLNVLTSTANLLRDQVEKHTLVDVGAQVERHLGISRGKLDTAIAMLRDEGYTFHYIPVRQLGTGKETSQKVLAPPGMSYGDAARQKDKIRVPFAWSEDGGANYFIAKPPLSISSNRVAIRYGEDGGGDSDGVVYVRPGVKDVSFGSNQYAQVRIAVEGTHYIKGMAVYKSDLPPGVDLLVNTPKANTGNKLDALKEMEADPDAPFGSTISRQLLTPDGKKPTSVMNMVNDEGDWDDWNRNLATQMLSKQSLVLARSQLKATYDDKKREFDEINALDNPVIRETLLRKFADSADSAAVHMKAKAMPGQATQVILPLNKAKETEIYAPNFNHGDSVVLVRYPHGGVFEIPRLTVNNKLAQGRELIGNGRDAVGINAKVAEKLSGADFDGDTVLVIPDNTGKIKTAPVLEGMKNFDAKIEYREQPGMKYMSKQDTGLEMGKVTNLITDMSLQNASSTEMARALRHSQVVIDAHKHKLNYKLSEQVNGIAALHEKYQGKKGGGAATLISKATSEVYIDERKARLAGEGGPIDRETGQLRFTPTGNMKRVTKIDKKTGERVAVIDKATGLEKMEPKQQKVERLALTDDAHTLLSKTPTKMEVTYAEHSNRMKALANQARLASLDTVPIKRTKEATTTFKKEVDSLNAKLDTALKNAPLERQAQVLGNTIARAKFDADPTLDKEARTRIKDRALKLARTTTGANKSRIEVTPDEWRAIQAGAISTKKLKDIINNMDDDRVKELATPRQPRVMTTALQTRARTMRAAGKTWSEIAAVLGVPVSTVKSSIG